MVERRIIDLLNDYTFLYQNYILENKSRKALSLELNISENTLKYYLKKYKFNKDSKSVFENIKRTNLKKYGKSIFFSTKDFQYKASKTWLKKYGVNNPSKCKSIIDKQKESLENHFKKDPTFRDKIRNKTKETNLKKYGKEYFCLTDEYKAYYKDKEWLNKKHLKELETKKKNNSYTVSKEEEEVYSELCDVFNEVFRQYKSEDYPFLCDFYIPKFKLYIEYQGYWMHGYKPYDENDKHDNEILNNWIEKAKSSSQYKSAVNTWTVRDPLKRKTAKENNLNWIEFFTVLEFKNWLNIYKLNGENENGRNE